MLDLGRFPYKDAAVAADNTFKIEVNGKIYVVNNNTVLRNEVGVIEKATASDIHGAITANTTQVFDIVADDDNVISSFKYVAADADRDAAKVVIDMIDALDADADTFAADVAAARAAYTALSTDVQKNLVTNLADLEAAEAAVANAAAVADVAADKEALDADAIKGTNVDLDNVTGDLTKVASGDSGNTTITWTSSNTDVIDNDLKVTQPSYTEGDATVTLTATITHDTVTTVKDTKEFVVTVKAADITADEEIALDRAALEIGFADGDSISSVTSNLTLPTSGDNGTTISWASSNETIIKTDGTVTRPSGIDVQVTLKATISKSGGTDATKVFVVTVLGE